MLISLLFFCVITTNAFAQQTTLATPAKATGTGNACQQTNTAIPPNLLAAICETMGSPDEIAKTAKQAGMEVTVSKNKDGRVVSYSIINPANGQRVVVKKRLIIVN